MIGIGDPQFLYSFYSSEKDFEFPESYSKVWIAQPVSQVQTMYAFFRSVPEPFKRFKAPARVHCWNGRSIGVSVSQPHHPHHLYHSTTTSSSIAETKHYSSVRSITLVHTERGDRVLVNPSAQLNSHCSFEPKNEKKKKKNIQQQVFAGGHPPNY